MLDLKCPCSCILHCQAERLQICGSKHAMHIPPPKRRLAQILSKLSGTSLRTKLRKALEKIMVCIPFHFFLNHAHL